MQRNDILKLLFETPYERLCVSAPTMCGPRKRESMSLSEA